MMKGFSVIEIILVISIFAIIAATTTPIYSNFLSRQYLENKTNEVITSLYAAKANSIAGKQDSVWGVHIDNKITLFQGSSFATRNPVFDQSYSIPASITLSGISELTFNRTNGDASTTGDIIVSNNIGESNTININSLGTINLN